MSKGIYRVLLLSLLILDFCLGFRTICKSNQHPDVLRLSEHKIAKSAAYQYSISTYSGEVRIERNDNGTFFKGNLTSLTLLTKQGKKLQYFSSEFSFRYPPQHQVLELPNQMLELQITYQLDKEQHKGERYEKIIMSVGFVLIQYVPQDKQVLKKEIHQGLQDGDEVDMNKLLKVVSGLPMVIYRGAHSSNPTNESVLWMIRKELNLMAFEEFQVVKSVIFGHRNKEQINYQSVQKKSSELYEIKEIKSNVNEL